jgi:hypothetical protein
MVTSFKAVTAGFCTQSLVHLLIRRPWHADDGGGDHGRNAFIC